MNVQPHRLLGMLLPVGHHSAPELEPDEQSSRDDRERDGQLEPAEEVAFASCNGLVDHGYESVRRRVSAGIAAYGRGSPR